MFCDQCGSEVKETESFCSNCGAPVQKQPVDQPVEPVEPSQDNSYTTPSDNQMQPPKAKGGIKKGILISVLAGAAVLVVLMAVLIANAASVSNFIHKTFSSPEDYYRFVEKKAVQDTVSAVGDIYGSTVLEGIDFYDQKVDAKLSMELGEAGQEYVELLGLIGVDLSWFHSVDINSTYNMGENIIDLNVAAAINGDSIVSGDLLMDADEETLYIRIPELSDTYVGIELGDYLDSGMRRQLDEIEEQKELRQRLKEACPSQKEAEELFSRYINIVLDQVDDVQKESGTVEAEGIEQKCTKLQVVIDADTLENIYVSVLEEMMKDEELKKIIIDVTNASDSGEDGEDVYEDFLDSIEDALDDLDFSSYDSDAEMVMTVYVDGKGEIRGRKIKITYEGYYGDEMQEITVLMPQKGKNFGYELSYESSYDSNDYALVGSGRRSGDKITGDFRFRSNGTSLVDITATDLDTETLKRGKLNGRLSLKPSSAIGRLLGMSGTGFSFGDLQLDIDAKTGKKDYEYHLTVMYDDEELGQISASMKRQAAAQSKVPGDAAMVEDAGDLMDWLEDVDWDEVISKLDETDLPFEVIDALEDFAEMVESGELQRALDYYSYYAY